MALNCESFDCIHNDNDGKCFAKIIAVRGREAKTSDKTVCHSYVPTNGWLNFEFAHDFMEADISPSNTQNIKCAAEKCMYNFKAKCTARSVLIDDTESSCETFRT